MFMVDISTLLIGASVATVVVAVAFLLIAYKKYAEASSLEQNSKEQLKNSKRDIETERQAALIKIKDEMYHKRKEFELELKRERIEIDRLQTKLGTKSEHLEKREVQLDDLRIELQQKERNLSRLEDAVRINDTKVKNLYTDLIVKLEQLSGMSKEDARNALFGTIESEVRLASQKYVQKVEEEARQTAKEKSSNIVIGAMQRYTADLVAPYLSGIVHLPNEEMKGRIIGKEGRNIKALEMATGMEFVIGDTPEVITISGFNPVRREIARRSLEGLINDGRINPTRIEET